MKNTVQLFDGTCALIRFSLLLYFMYYWSINVFSRRVTITIAGGSTSRGACFFDGVCRRVWSSASKDNRDVRKGTQDAHQAKAGRAHAGLRLCE
jgi:hypothetical protein